MVNSDFAPIVDYAVIRECLGRWSGHNEFLDLHNIMFIMKGECDLYINGTYHRLTAGDVSYCPLGSERSVGNSTVDAEIYAFDFRLYGADKLPLPDVSHFDSFDIFTHDLKNFFYSWYQKNDGYVLLCSGIFMMILSRLIYPGGEKIMNRHVNMIKEYIAEHIGEHMTVGGIARTVNLSPVYCGTLFVKNEGMTIHEFINNMRVNIAKDLLVDDSRPISEIATVIGYNDVFHFSKIFKRITGMTPSEYRRIYIR